MGLRVTIIQSDIHWENKRDNLLSFESKIQSVRDSHLIILPETFSTGFSMNVKELSEELSGHTLEKMKMWAAESSAVIIGSYIVRVVDRYYNRLLWVNPDGSYETYDKKHLFSLGKEHLFFSPGKNRLISSVNGWRVCPMVCYDLRFPVFCRNTLLKERECEYDVLIFVANWPDKRIDAWDKLLMARAIENQSYVIGVNRIGEDGNGVRHSGHSSIYDPMGSSILDCENEECIQTIELNGDFLEKTRRALPFLKDADSFEIKEPSSEEIKT